jgi:hypothetical protein
MKTEYLGTNSCFCVLWRDACLALSDKTPFGLPQVWENARQQYPPDSKEVRTAEELSALFNRLYQEKVRPINLFRISVSQSLLAESL